VLVVALFAGLVYAVLWSIERRRTGGSPGGSSGGSSGRPARRSPFGPANKPPPRQVAPDDDEDFLRWLDRKRRNGSSDT